LTTGEISAHFAEVYGASISKDTISRITDKVVEEMQDWASRPLQGVYAAIFIDAIYVKVRDGQVGNQPFYAAIGVDLAGHRDVLGLRAGKGGGEREVLDERARGLWLEILVIARTLSSAKDYPARSYRGVLFAGASGPLAARLIGVAELVDTVVARPSRQ